MRFRDLRLGTKQLLSFGLILVIVAGVHLYSRRTMETLTAAVDEIATNWLPRAVSISDLNFNTSRLRMTQLRHASTEGPDERRAQAGTLIALIDRINENLDTYEKLKIESEARGLYSEEERALYQAFDEQWEVYQDLSFEFFGLVQQGRGEAALRLLNGPARQVYRTFSNQLIKLVEVNKRQSSEAAGRAKHLYRRAHRVTAILYVATIGLSIFIALGLVRFITVPVHKLEEAAGRVAEGDLTVRLEVSSRDEIGNLARSFNQMTTALRDAKEKMEQQAKKLRQQNQQLENALRELRNTQEHLIMKDRMAALGDLVAGITHEINNPIGAVSSSADVGQRCVAKIEETLSQSRSLDEVEARKLSRFLHLLKDNIRVTIEASERVVTIVQSLKNFARLDEAAYQKVDIHEGLDSSLTLLEPEFENRITVIKQYGKLPKITCYASELNQVFMSLLKNATQAIDGAGTITVRTFRKDDLIHVEFTDTGRGIPPDKLSRIFDFGFSAVESRVRMSSGLSTAYNIVLKHDGDIKVQSEVGKGSTFSVVLPVR